MGMRTQHAARHRCCVERHPACKVGVDNGKEKEEEQQRSLHSSMRYQNDTKVCMGGGVCLGLWIMK